ncbi:hypothetical protein B0H10DRAFT_2010518 [Mycena sp. CBHHK59/15]|nr:hypothetical protein B0H10DRAFT_2010518 [Mycena sp. CBHHK59/15]
MCCVRCILSVQCLSYMLTSVPLRFNFWICLLSVATSLGALLSFFEKPCQLSPAVALEVPKLTD